MLSAFDVRAIRVKYAWHQWWSVKILCARMGINIWRHNECDEIPAESLCKSFMPCLDTLCIACDGIYAVISKWFYTGGIGAKGVTFPWWK